MYPVNLPHRAAVQASNCSRDRRVIIAQAVSITISARTTTRAFEPPPEPTVSPVRTELKKKGYA